MMPAFKFFIKMIILVNSFLFLLLLTLKHSLYYDWGQLFIYEQVVSWSRKF